MDDSLDLTNSDITSAIDGAPQAAPAPNYVSGWTKPAYPAWEQNTIDVARPMVKVAITAGALPMHGLLALGHALEGDGLPPSDTFEQGANLALDKLAPESDELQNPSDAQKLARVAGEAVSVPEGWILQSPAYAAGAAAVAAPLFKGVGQFPAVLKAVEAMPEISKAAAALWQGLQKAPDAAMGAYGALTGALGGTVRQITDKGSDAADMVENALGLAPLALRGGLAMAKDSAENIGSGLRQALSKFAPSVIDWMAGGDPDLRTQMQRNSAVDSATNFTDKDYGTGDEATNDWTRLKALASQAGGWLKENVQNLSSRLQNTQLQEAQNLMGEPPPEAIDAGGNLQKAVYDKFKASEKARNDAFETANASKDDPVPSDPAPVLSDINDMLNEAYRGNSDQLPLTNAQQAVTKFMSMNGGQPTYDGMTVGDANTLHQTFLREANAAKSNQSRDALNAAARMLEPIQSHEYLQAQAAAKQHGDTWEKPVNNLAINMATEGTPGNPKMTPEEVYAEVAQNGGLSHFNDVAKVLDPNDPAAPRTTELFAHILGRNAYDQVFGAANTTGRGAGAPVAQSALRKNDLRSALLDRVFGGKSDDINDFLANSRDLATAMRQGGAQFANIPNLSGADTPSNGLVNIVPGGSVAGKLSKPGFWARGLYGDLFNDTNAKSLDIIAQRRNDPSQNAFTWGIKTAPTRTTAPTTALASALGQINAPTDKHPVITLPNLNNPEEDQRSPLVAGDQNYDQFFDSQKKNEGGSVSAKDFESQAALLAPKIERVESNRQDYPPDSSAGAIGPMQLEPKTAKWIAQLSGMDPNKIDIRDPATNRTLGTKYIAWLLNHYQGNEQLASAAYNGGQGTVDGALKASGGSIWNDINDPKFIEAKETRDYVKKVLG